MSLLSRFRAVGAVALLAPLVPAVGAPAASAASGDVVINEVRIDQPGSDVDEYLELAGTPGAALDGLTFLVIGDGAATAGSGVIENVTPLDGFALGTDGLLLLAEASLTLGTADQTVFLNFENSDNVTMLVVSGFSGTHGADLDTDDDGALDTTPWTEITDSISLVESLDASGTERYYSTTVVGPDGTLVPAHAYRCAAGFVIGTFDPVGGSDSPGAANPCPPEPVTASISEIRIDQPGTDVDEYFELSGTPGDVLNGLSYLVIGDGSTGSGTVEEWTPLDGVVVPASGFLVAGDGLVSLARPDLLVDLNFENSDNVTHLVVRDYTGTANTDLDVDDDGVIDAAPWSEVVDSVGLVATVGSGDLLYSNTLVGPDGTLVPGHVFVCEGSWQIGLFDTTGGDDTPGSANACGTVVDPFGECLDGAATLISGVQGAGTVSPLAGQSVVIEGVVTADFQSTLSALFVQEEDTDVDGDPLTSEGIAVFTGTSPATVAVGDVIRVQGTATEFFEFTEISPAERIEVCAGATGTATPAVITLPETDARDLEAYEGMITTYPQTLTVSDTFNLGRFGEIVLSADGRQYSSTHVFAPAPGLDEDLDGDSVPDSLEPGRILLDDVSNGSITYGPGDLPPYVNGDGTRRVGDTVTGLTAIVDYGFDEYRLRPVGDVPFVDVNLRTAAPDPGGDVTVASFNVLNFFDTPDSGVAECGPMADQGCRGADSAAELQRQQDKITGAITEMNADVVGLIEIENDDTSLDTLVAGLPGYAAIDPGPIGIDAIEVAFVYTPDSVAPVGSPAILDAAVDADFDDTKNRPALAQTFDDLATGDRFTVVVSHLKSKGSPCDDIGDPDTGNGSGNCDGVRTRAARALADWLATDPTGEGDGDVLIIGDLNAYAQEAPITTLEAAGYTDLLEAFVPFDDRYSFVFRGGTGYLDHALANDSLLANVAGAAVWHINADEPRFIDYNDDVIDPTEFSDDLNPAAAFAPDAYRSSDHDPVLVGLDMEAAETTAREDLASLTDAIEVGASGDRKALEAADSLERALADRYWLDDDTLGAKGNQALGLHSRAAARLQRSGLDEAVVDAWLADLYAIDRRLAAGAVEAAVERGGRPNLIKLATAGVAIGDRLQSSGFTSAAIRALTLAWLWARAA
jgi:predicted extracellular nuclease